MKPNSKFDDAARLAERRGMEQRVEKMYLNCAELDAEAWRRQSETAAACLAALAARKDLAEALKAMEGEE